MFHMTNFAFHFSQFRINLKTSLKFMSATFIKFYTSLATSVTTSSPLQHRHLLFAYIFRQDLQVYHTLRDCVCLLLPLTSSLRISLRYDLIVPVSLQKQPSRRILRKGMLRTFSKNNGSFCPLTTQTRNLALSSHITLNNQHLPRRQLLVQS